MKNVTISLDEDTAVWARVEAAKAGKSLSRFVGDLLSETRAGNAARHSAARSFLDGPLWDLSDSTGALPKRGDLYAEREDELLRRYQRAGLREGPPDGGETGEGR